MDLVLVSPGVYHEAVSVTTDDLVIRGTDRNRVVLDGQYRLAAFVAAVVAGEGWLPGPLNMALAILVAMLVGAMWAGVAALLKVTRGVSEVISTIMLNAIATALVAFLLRKASVVVPGSNDIGTQEIPEDS